MKISANMQWSSVTRSATIWALNLAIGIQLPSARAGENILPETARIHVSGAELGTECVALYSKPFNGTYLKQANNETRINYRHGEHIAPRLSPDGGTVLWHSTQGGRIGIWLADPTGDTSERVSDGEQASWSPDGMSIVFARDGRIVERELASGNERIVNPPQFSTCEFPSYLPDGRICFVRRGKPTDALYLLDRNQQPRLLRNAAIASTPRCSPDGSTIACQIGPHIWLLELEQLAVTQLTTAGGIQSWPVWSRDGKSLVYCQGPADGPWDIHHVTLGAPRQVRQVQRDVWPGADWNGQGIIGAEGLGRATGTNISQDLETKAQQTGAAIHTQWLTLSLHDKSDKITMRAQADERSQRNINISGPLGKPVTWETRVGHSRETIAQAFSSAADGKQSSLKVHVLPTRPSLELSCAVGPIVIETPMRFVVLPDRFANDLLVNPSKHSTATVLLPWSPMVLALLPGGQSALMAVTPTHDQRVTVVIDQGRCSGLRIDGAGQPVHLALLTAERLWSEPEITFDDGSSLPSLQWTPPFAGRWRASGFGSANHSLTISEKQVAHIKPIAEFEGDFDIALIYLFGRSWNTPLDTLTPADIALSAVGIDGSRELLDIEAITGYRTSEHDIPLHELLLPTRSRYRARQIGGTDTYWGLAWRKTLQPGLDFSPLLELLGGGDYGGINMADSPAVRSAVDHLCADIVSLLVGLDNRRQEYEKYLSDIGELCRHSHSSSEISRAISEFESSVSDAKVTDISDVKDQIEKLRALPGSDGALGKKEEFEEFCKISLAALSQRQSILQDNRQVIKDIRDTSGTLLAQNPQLKPFVEELRQLTQTALGNRYYLEGDWRGEIPQSRPVQTPQFP